MRRHGTYVEERRDRLPTRATALAYCPSRAPLCAGPSHMVTVDEASFGEVETAHRVLFTLLGVWLTKSVISSGCGPG